MFGDLNDCYGRALQQELAEANRLEQEMIEAGNRESDAYYADAYYAEKKAEKDNVDCGMVTNFRLLGDL